MQVPNDWCVPMQRAGFWLAKPKTGTGSSESLLLVIGYPSYILVQILVQGVTQIITMSGHFTHHSLLKRPHNGIILRGDNGNFWITAAVADWEKEYSSLILRNRTLAEMSNLQVNWEGQMSFLVDYY